MKKIMALVAGMVLMAPVASMAVPTLTLTSGADQVIVADGSGLDANILDNVVTYIGPVGPNWFLNVTTGIGIDAFAGNTYMDLNSVNSSTGAGVLTLQLTDDYNGGPVSGVTFNIGGTTSGTVVYSFALDGNPLLTSAPLGPGAFSNTSAVAFASPVTTAEFAQIVTITHNGGGTTSFNYETTTVPEPGTMLLLGSGLLGLGLMRRRRQIR